LSVVAVLLVVVAAVVAAMIVAAPLRAGRAADAEAAHASEIADLEAMKSARYSEIREVEMDFRTGKLSEADWKATDRQLRAEAMEVLRRRDALGADGTPPGDDGDGRAASHPGPETAGS
jgi:flagellar biosynthesis/type III secretory pathway M-ring protein FliF/YscJ